VVGIPDAEAGELPRAYVVIRPGNTLTEREVKQFVAGDLASLLHFRYLTLSMAFPSVL